MRILIINGPNINMLGIREPELYGERKYDELVEYCRVEAGKLGIETEFFQSNHEGAIVDAIQEAYGHTDGIIINPAAYSHTSVAIPDALRAAAIPTVEVHLTVPEDREEFRHRDYTAPVCVSRIVGMGFEGYKEAMEVLNNEQLS